MCLNLSSLSLRAEVFSSSDFMAVCNAKPSLSSSCLTSVWNFRSRFNRVRCACECNRPPTMKQVKKSPQIRTAIGYVELSAQSWLSALYANKVMPKPVNAVITTTIHSILDLLTFFDIICNASRSVFIVQTFRTPTPFPEEGFSRVLFLSTT